MREKGNRALPLPLRVQARAVALWLLVGCVASEESVCILKVPDEITDAMFPNIAPEDILPGRDLPPCQTYLDTSLFFVLTGDKCDSVPRNTTLANPFLSVSKTNIDRLEEGAFYSWSGVEMLQLTLNQHLDHIGPRAFVGLDQLWNLSISDNCKLSYLVPDTFQGVIQLQQLRLLRNNFKSLSDISLSLVPGLLPNLTYLDISGYSFPHISRDAFSPMKGIQLYTLVLTMTKTEYIHPDTLNVFEYSLAEVRLGKNNLNNSVSSDLIESFKSVNPHFVALNLQRNLMYTEPDKLFNAVADSNICNFVVRDNELPVFSAGFFPTMNNMFSLNLESLYLDFLPKGVINDTIFPKLSRLYLGRNKFSGLPKHLDSTTVTHLYMQGNTAALFWSTVFDIPSDYFDKLPQLELLDLSENYIHSLRRGQFSNATNLKLLYLSNANINFIDDFVFDNCSQLYHLDLSKNIFPHQNTFSKNIFRGLSCLKALDLSGCNIESINDPNLFEYLTSLQHLSLRDNSLQKFGVQFDLLPNLIQLDLRSNHIFSWHSPAFSKNKQLQNLYVGGNQICSLTDAMITDFTNLTKVDLSNNPFICDCSLVKIIRKYKEDYKDGNLSHLNLNGTLNLCSSEGSKYVTKTIDNFLQEMVNKDVCYGPPLGIILPSVFGGLVVLFVVVAVVVHKWKWQLKYYYYLTKDKLGLMQLPLMKRRKSVGAGEYKYDAFVSYSHEDSKFVKVMVAILEGEFKLRLCVFERDFKIGEVISSVVMESVAASRVTLLVLSEAFVKSQWCLWELQFAHHRAAFFRKARPDSLVVLKLEEIDQQLLTPNLAFLIKTRIYLQWDSHPNKKKVLWHQLKNAILQS